MKKNRLKLALLLSLLFLDSCMITQQELWGSKSYNEDIKAFSIDREANEVVLFGANQKDSGYNYIIGDPAKNMQEIFELGIVSGYIKISIDYPQAKGSEVCARSIGIGFNKSKLSNSKISFLHSKGFKDAKIGNIIGNRYENICMARRTSSEISYHQEQIPLEYDGDIRFWERNAPLKTTGKILLTPFAVVADILMAPFYIIGVFGTGAGSK